MDFKMYRFVFTLILILLSFKTASAESSNHGFDNDWLNRADAKAEMKNNIGEKIGTIYAKQGTQGVLLRLKFSKMPQGIHGMHFHNIGDCSEQKSFKSAGGHINVHQQPHGFLNPQGPHEGNLPNLIIAPDGSAHLELYSQMVSVFGKKNGLLDENGSSLIVHTNIDDHTSQPIGGAGARIACGVFILHK
ncbi:MAG: Cu-Zn family superoxide dismutase [Alphaproteobacteria bacterium]|jgi:Cu-Zn family superoxide dismutase